MTYANHKHDQALDVALSSAPDTRPGFYYVSMIRSGGDYRFLAGPFTTHAKALAMVDGARARACQVDPRGHWYAYGTARCEEDAGPGILNADLGIPQ